MPVSSPQLQRCLLRSKFRLCLWLSLPSYRMGMPHESDPQHLHAGQRVHPRNSSPLSFRINDDHRFLSESLPDPLLAPLDRLGLLAFPALLALQPLPPDLSFLSKMLVGQYCHRLGFGLQKGYTRIKQVGFQV